MASSLLTRRSILHYGSASVAVLLGTGAVGASAGFAAPRSSLDPFTLGVASGDPRHDGVVLWTRLAPEPFAPDGRAGMPSRSVSVSYEVASDSRFRSIVARGSVLATPQLAHSVHPEVTGLRADRRYWYRFRAGRHISPVGRTRTTPHPRSSPRRLQFAYASCQNWQDGYYTAYDHMAREDLDLVVHLGDYIYETPLKQDNRRGVPIASPFDREAFTLDDYRLRYALYKSEQPLQRAHAAFPWIHTIDDHEVENDYAGSRPDADQEPNQDRAAFRRRRAAAFQAMYENLPLRRSQLPSGPDVRLHRRIRYGRLADFTMLETRQYRSDQPCSTEKSSSCEERFDPDQTMLGGKQRRWLLDGFSSSPARWQILGNQAPMGQIDLRRSKKTLRVWLDAWDGYVAERNELLAQAQSRGVRNLVVLTGDRHRNYAVDLKADYAKAGSDLVGAEFVGTSITSGGDGADMNSEGRTVLAANPHLKFYNAQRGYVRMDVTRTQCQADFRVLPYVTRPGASIRTRASYVVENGRPGVQRG